MPAIDMIGRTFGRLVVADFSHKNRNGQLFFRCQCSCGREAVVRGAYLRNQTTTSCGCVQREHIAQLKLSHGCNRTGKRTPEYRSWADMIKRCTNPKAVGFKHYGGRGITVCDRWRNSFANFLADMGTKPSPHHSIDRIDNDRGYEPNNCRWATRRQQQLNTQRNRRITFGGRTQTLTEWAAETGLSRATLWTRLDSGWSVEQALTAPLHSQRKKHDGTDDTSGLV